MAGNLLKYGEAYNIKKKSRYTTIWLEKQGHKKSFRVLTERLEEDLATFLSLGWTRLPDPFRKGAPLGGYRGEKQ